MLKTAISNVRKIADGAWEAQLSPSDVGAIARPLANEPGASVVLAMVEEGGAATVLFTPGTARVLNRGNTDRAFVLALPPAGAVGADQVGHAGDDAFLEEAAKAGPDVEKFARRMLEGIRKLDPDGELVSFPGRRFINKPDNFVVLVPQPRVRELKVVVRGRPHEFGNAPDDLKADQNGYSTFKIRNATDLARGLDLLKEIRRK